MKKIIAILIVMFLATAAMAADKVDPKKAEVYRLKQTKAKMVREYKPIQEQFNLSIKIVRRCEKRIKTERLTLVDDYNEYVKALKNNINAIDKAIERLTAEVAKEAAAKAAKEAKDKKPAAKATATAKVEKPVAGPKPAPKSYLESVFGSKK